MRFLYDVEVRKKLGACALDSSYIRINFDVRLALSVHILAIFWILILSIFYKVMELRPVI